MTLEEAKAILKEAEETWMPISPPRKWGNALCFEVEGIFSAEEFEAFAMILRAYKEGNM